MITNLSAYMPERRHDLAAAEMEWARAEFLDEVQQIVAQSTEVQQTHGGSSTQAAGRKPNKAQKKVQKKKSLEAFDKKKNALQVKMRRDFASAFPWRNPGNKQGSDPRIDQYTFKRMYELNSVEREVWATWGEVKLSIDR